MKTTLTDRCRQWWAWQQRVPAGLRILVLVLALVGGRYLWVGLHRPAHRMELADAYSINLFYGAPECDSQGRRVTYVATADRGFAVFLADTETGERTNVREENALGPWGSAFDLRVWPWSPDGRTFVYSAGRQVHICDAASGKAKTQLNLPAEMSALVWLDERALDCIGQDAALYQVRREPDGDWQIRRTLRPERALASTENAPFEGAAQAVDGLVNTKWYNNNRPPPWWLQYQFANDTALAVSEYSLTSGNDFPSRDPKDWQFQGSNDGSNWVTLDSRSGEAFSSRFERRTYPVMNAAPYRSYRLHVTRKAGDDDNSLQLSEFALTVPNAEGRLMELRFPRNPFVDVTCMTTLASDTIAWSSRDALWSMHVSEEEPELLVDCRKAGVRLDSFSYSKVTGEFLLNCTEDEAPLIYRFNRQNAARPLREVVGGSGVEGAVWLADSDETQGWAGIRNDSLMIHPEKKTETPSAIAMAKVAALSLTPDNRQIFFFGTVTNEPAAGLWRYNLTDDQLKSVVAYADNPSKRARKIEPVRDFILSAEGKYSIYLPADFYEHPDRKYPLVIGDTDFGFAAQGAYGRMWASAVASCNAFVVVVNRDDWFAGLEQWEERVTAAVEELSARLPIDHDRMFLFGVSAETRYVSEFLNESAGRWRGVIFLNPTGLPDLSGQSPLVPMPKILISAGALEGNEERLRRFQKDALASGMLVELVIAPGEKHHLVGNAAQRQRTQAMINFIFGH